MPLAAPTTVWSIEVTVGAVMFGVGSGYLAHEFAGYGIDPKEKRDRFNVALDVVGRLMAGETVGKAVLNVLPHQGRVPPIYVAILARDGAYHNGTVWAWLMGAFLEAYLRVNKRSKESIEQAKAWLAPLIEHMNKTGCIGSISEIFEADPPHRPVGACAQAWSVAEALRLATELGM